MGSAADRWDETDPATAVFVVELQGTTCAEATPVLPTVVPAVCVDGAVTSHTITLPTTDNITYSLTRRVTRPASTRVPTRRP